MYDDNPSTQGVYRLGVVSSQAFSIANFRGPLIAEMVRQGIKVYALAPDYDEMTRECVRKLGAIPIDSSMSRAGMNPLRDFADLFGLVRQLRELRLDSVFCYFIKPVIYGLLASRLAGIPRRFAMIEGAGYVFTDSGSLSTGRRLLRTCVTALYRTALSQAERVFMLNPDDKKMFVGQRMVSAAKVQLLNGIGLDLSHYTVVPPPLGATCFILMARLLREKGVYDYIEAARKVKAIHPEVRFVLLGSVDVNPSSISEAEVNDWVMQKLIEWPGHVEDVRKWIAMSSVFVLPSYREGLPRSTQEAMAMGRPVITTDVPGCRETVIDEVNGFMVPVRDPSALADAMIKFVREPQLVAKMGAAGRAHAERLYDVHRINRIVLQTMQVGNVTSDANGVEDDSCIQSKGIS